MSDFRIIQKIRKSVQHRDPQKFGLNWAVQWYLLQQGLFGISILVSNDFRAGNESTVTLPWICCFRASKISDVGIFKNLGHKNIQTSRHQGISSPPAFSKLSALRLWRVFTGKFRTPMQQKHHGLQEDGRHLTRTRTRFEVLDVFWKSGKKKLKLKYF